MIAEYSTQMSPTPEVSYLSKDHLGSPRITTGKTGNVISRRDFQPYGEEITRTGYGTDNVRNRFTGYERDDETGLDFAQARYYSNNLGRFSSVDPVMMKKSRMVDPQQINLYAYVRNNPFKFVDVTGEDLVPADAKSAKQLESDLAQRLTKAELANLQIVSGQNIVIVNSQFQSSSTAYTEVVNSITSSKVTTYFSVSQGSNATLPSGQVLSWDDVRSGATVPIDTNDLTTANKIHIYVPESGGNSQVDGQNGQLIDFPRDLVSFHEIAHGNCGPGQCAVDTENKIRGEQTPALPLRSGLDHQSIPINSVQTSKIAPVQVQISMPGSNEVLTTADVKVETKITPRQINPLPPLKKP